jgi:lipopolysaccharide transport system permease protein
MNETVYAARADLSDPARFLRDARRDLGSAPRIGWQLFRGQLRIDYRQSRFPHLWLLLAAVATTFVVVHLRSRGVIDAEGGPVPYSLHVLVGILLWQTFVEALNLPLRQLTARQRLISQSRVPHEALIVAGCFELALTAAVRLVLLVVVLAVYGAAPTTDLLLVPLGAAGLCTLGLGFGLLLAPWGLLYGDIGRGLLAATTLWFFLSPVIYSAPDSVVMRLNPVSPLLDSTRAWLTGGTSEYEGLLAAFALAIVLTAAAWAVLRLARPHVLARLG